MCSPDRRRSTSRQGVPRLGSRSLHHHCYQHHHHHYYFDFDLDLVVRLMMQLLHHHHIIAIYVAAAGVAVSTLTYWYRKKEFRLKSLTEALSRLNDVKHKEAHSPIRERNLCIFRNFGFQ
jgi:hypothetical protein